MVIGLAQKPANPNRVLNLKFNRAVGVSEISCVGRAVDPVQAMARVKRSPKRMAN